MKQISLLCLQEPTLIHIFNHINPVQIGYPVFEVYVNIYVEVPQVVCFLRTSPARDVYTYREAIKLCRLVDCVVLPEVGLQGLALAN